MRKLLVIINYPVSPILKKGEFIPGYYNPGDLFDEVHILMTVADNATDESMQFTGGRARVFLHTIPSPSMKKSLGWQPFLLQSWISRCTDFVRGISPDLIRVHNSFIQGYLASELKKRLGIPYVMSLHGTFDRDELSTWQQRLIHFFRKKLEKISIRHSDAVIAVYSPIIRYAREYGATNIHLIYNAVAGGSIIRKTDYALADPPVLITINRQAKEKNPENIIRAIKNIDCRYIIVGDGVLHSHLLEVAKLTGVQDKVQFIKAIPNADLVQMLPGCDILVSHCDGWGISKSMIEGSLAGLPIIMNNHPVEDVPDLQGGWVHLCDNTPEAYEASILSLLGNEEKRRRLGSAAYEHAAAEFDPRVMVSKTVQVYQSLLKG